MNTFYLIITDLGEAPIQGACRGFPFLQSFGRTFPGKQRIPKKQICRPVRMIPERTDLLFCRLIISGCCALP